MNPDTASKALTWTALLAALAFAVALLAGCASGLFGGTPVWYRDHIRAARAAGKPAVFFRADAVVTDHLGGVSLIVEWVNTAADTVRYLDVTAVPVNAVGDTVASEIGGHIAFSGRATGPFAPGDEVHGAVWRGAWYNGSVRCARLAGVRFEYGTTRTERVVTITDPDSLHALVAPAEVRPFPEHYCQ